MRHAKVLAAGLVGLAMLWTTACGGSAPAPTAAPTSAPATTAAPTVAPTASSNGSNGGATGQAIFTGVGGCLACHTIEGVPGAVGQVCPNLTHIGTDAATRKPGMDARAYIEESIRTPEAFVADDVEHAQPGIMTAAITANLSDDQINALVDFLLGQK